MQRKVISLSKDTVLWEIGDAARDIAVVSKGKLGARTLQGDLVGVILPNMVLGESALFTIDGQSEGRTAAIFALEDDTLVIAYPARMVREEILDGVDGLARQLLSTLVGQVCRNLLMVITAKRGYAYIDAPLTALVESVVRDAQLAQPVRTWETVLMTCRFLTDLRDLSDRLLLQLGPDIANRRELVERASQMLAQLFTGQDIQPVVAAFLAAEQEKTEWWARRT